MPLVKSIRKLVKFQGHRPVRMQVKRHRTEHTELLEERLLLAADVWTQRGGDAGHTSYVDVSFDAAALEPEWAVGIGYSQSGTGSWSERAVAIDDNHVYRTALQGYAPSGTYHVFAFDVDTGSQAWHRTFVGNAFEGVGEPSLAGGIVYVNRAGHSGISGGTNADLPRIYGLDAGTGATVLEKTYAAQWGSNDRPVIADNQLVVEDGYYGGISTYTATTLSKQWFDGRSSGNNRPFAALGDDFVYAFNNEVYRRSTGAQLGNIVPPTGYTSVREPIVSDTGKVLFEVSGSGVYGVAAYDDATRQVLWTTATAVSPGAKAVGNGIVAVTAGRDLLLLNEADGTILRTWNAPQSLIANDIILTQTHAFVQSTSGSLATVYAIDLATGLEVWSYQHNFFGGAAMEMAFGGGHLVLSHHQFVRAFAVPRKPDLTARAFNAVSDHVLNGVTDVTFTVENQGNSDAGPFDTHIIWSANEVLGDQDDVVVTGTVESFSDLAAGTAVTRTIPVQLDEAALYSHALAATSAGGPVGTPSTEASYLFLVVDTANSVSEADETNNSGLGHLVDGDDITYFPWDRDANGTVEPLDALAAIQAIATIDPMSDLDGDGVVSPLEALSAVQRIGYVRNESVIGDSPAYTSGVQPAAHSTQAASMAPMAASPVVAVLKDDDVKPSGAMVATSATAPLPVDVSPFSTVIEEDDDDLFAEDSRPSEVTDGQGSDTDQIPEIDEGFESTDWLSVI